MERRKIPVYVKSRLPHENGCGKAAFFGSNLRIEPGLALYSFFLKFVRLTVFILFLLVLAYVGLCLSPGIGLLHCFILGDAVAFLDAADQLLFLSGDLVPVAVSQLAPLFTGLAPHLFPVAFNSIPIHKVKISFSEPSSTIHATSSGAKK